MNFHRISLVCALLTTGLGALSLIGWATGMEALASVRRIYIPMAPSTALGFTILGTVVGLQLGNRIRRPIAEILAEVRTFAQRPEFDDDVCVIGVEVARSIGPTDPEIATVSRTA